MSTKIELSGAQVSDLRKRFMITQSCVYAAMNALEEAGSDTDAEAVSYAFSEFRAELEKAIPGISPNNMPDPAYKLN